MLENHWFGRTNKRKCWYQNWNSRSTRANERNDSRIRRKRWMNLGTWRKNWRMLLRDWRIFYFEWKTKSSDRWKRKWDCSKSSVNWRALKRLFSMQNSWKVKWYVKTLVRQFEALTWKVGIWAKTSIASKSWFIDRSRDSQKSDQTNIFRIRKKAESNWRWLKTILRRKR